MKGEPPHDPTETSPPTAAFEAYLAGAEAMGDHPVVVIEGGYFDQRDPRAEDRMVHLQDSFLLMENLQAIPPGRRPQIILAVLVNDFWSAGAYCGLDFRGQESVLERPCRETGSLEEIPAEARVIYEKNCGTLDKCQLRVFSMKSTRNRAAKAIAQALKTASGAERKLREVVDGDVVDIFVDTDYEERYLGCRREGTFRMSIRCTALMAQHYFDLYRQARAGVPQMTGLWIFDFDRFTESSRVRAGAEASFALHSWPPGLPIKVVNCIYFPAGVQRRPLQITTHA